MRIAQRYGWTNSAMAKFLPGDGPRWPIEVIEAIEATPQWEEWLVGYSRRSQIALRRADAQRQRMLEWVRSLDIKVVQVDSKRRLVTLAIEHYNDRQVWYGTDRWADYKSDKAFLRRITVNFLRHEGSHYEEALDSMFGKTGKTDAYIELKSRILNAIAKQYPYLAEEAMRQRKEVIALEKERKEYLNEGSFW